MTKMNKKPFKIKKWLRGHLPVLSVSDAATVTKIMNSNDITYMGERLKVEIALLERLAVAGQLKERHDTVNYNGKLLRSK